MTWPGWEVVVLPGSLEVELAGELFAAGVVLGRRRVISA